MLFENGPGTNGQIREFSFFIFFDSKLNAGAGQFTGKLVPDFGHQKQKQDEAHNDNWHPQRCEENHISSIANEI